MNQYIPLHVHTHFSLLDGVATPFNYAQRAKELGMTACAITDHGTLAGHREFVREMEKVGIKPILGCEVYICDDISQENQYNHMVLLAKNDEGLKNLHKLQEIAWTEGFNRKPRIDYSLLEQYSSGLVATSGCLSGPLAKAIEQQNQAKAVDYLHRMQTVFGNDFFIEIMPHNPREMNEQLIWYAKELYLPFVATPDCHHATPDQRVLNEIMLILNTHAKAVKNKSTISDPIERLNDLYGADRQMSFNKFDIHMLSAAELAAGMSYLPAEVLQDALNNTLSIAEQIEPYTVSSNLNLLPAAEGKTDLDKLAHQRLNKMGLTSQKYVDRLNEELFVINEKNFAPYFMIVYNMITWARRHNIRVGPGRGSAAGSLLCYVLGITQIDPLKYDLLFSRFLNPERNDMPDIDVDIQDSRREEVKQYLHRKYGNVANITTWLTWADKGVIRDVARVFMVPLADVNKALKNVHTFEQFERDRDIEWFRQQYPDVLKYARLMRGRIRGSGVHAAGVVVCKDAISNYAPIETRLDNRTKQRQVTIGLDKDEAELVGLTKIDVLGLKSLSVLQDFCDITGVNFDNIPPVDEEVFKDIAAGYTKGVFQLDAPAYTKLCMQMKIANFNDLVASNALVRPGAMNTIGKEYVQRRLGKSNIQQIHPIYDRITASTYGLVIYQEQVMQLCVELGGMSVGEADKVRKIIGKKRDVSEFDVWHEHFVRGASKHVGTDRAEWLWHSFEAHADYSFNKCTSGDTVITKSSGGKYGSQYVTIEKLWYDWHHGKKSTQQKYRTRGVKIMGRDSSDGRIRPFKVLNVWQQGFQPVWEVALENGKSIKATANHRHLTDSGWKRVDELTLNDSLATMGQQEHFANPTGGVGYIKNGRKFAYETVKKRSHNKCEKCHTSAGRLEIAHLNHDRTDNRLFNITLLCNSCHKQHDWDTGRRKPRHSRGRPVEYSRINMIQFVGYEMTYDLEIDSEDHSWIGDGIVTHNSHAVAYSTLSYQTAWAKHYYPLQFIYASIKNERDQSERSALFMEARRLGIDVLYPHVDKSGKTMTIEGNALRMGLTDIKHVASNIADTILKDAPYGSYKNWEYYSSKHTRHINKTVRKALDVVGALQFDDVDRPPVESEIYDYLGIPNFEFDVNMQFDRIDDYDEESAFIFKGVVRNIKRGKGWARAEIIDNTGICSLFVSESTTIEVGQAYIFVVAGNSLVTATPTSPVVEKYLRKEYDEHGQYIVATQARTTKNGKRIMNIVYAERDELRHAMVFDKNYVKGMARLKPGKTVKEKIGRLQDGTRYFSLN